VRQPHQKVAIITGATGNLGAATAHAFTAAGYNLVLIDRSSERLAETFHEIPPETCLLAGGIDLSNPLSVEKPIADATAQFGRIDVLVNTVGAWKGGKPVHEENLATWDFLLNVNLRTTLHCARAVIPKMLAQGAGKIINIASHDALAASPRYAAYSVSKSAVLRLTEALAAELKDKNINVNCILPGTIDTPQNRAALPNADFTKWVEPAALADVILFLASDSARAINGAALPVFGRN
jgi:NAD(P)-dependent dehydrogenase (short-subunit alcohol dehydrogenase family)